MIKVKTYEKNSCRKFTSHIDGTVSDIFMDMCYVVRGVYDTIKETSQSDAEDFKELMLIALNDPPFWYLDNSPDESVHIHFPDIQSGGQT